MGAFEGVDSGARAVSTRDDDASGGGSGRTENRVVANAMRSSSRIRARADGDAYAEAEMMMSQRETVTYHAPAAASGHSSRATSECGSRERDSAALTRLFHMGSATTIGGVGRAGRRNWGRGWAGPTAAAARRRRSAREG